MMERPIDVDERELAALVGASWQLGAVELRYAPVGFGGHHWEAVLADGERRFVTLAAGDLAQLRVAMEASVALAVDAGLDFVVAPLSTKDGRVVVPFGNGYGVTLFEYVDGTSGRWSDVPPQDERLPMAELLAGLHGATGKVRGLAAHEPGLAERAALDVALDELGLAWSGGPYAEPVRELLARHASALRDVLAGFDEKCARIRGMEPVVTHGEPHQGNVLHADGRRLLIDWDTVRLAPRERDLWIGVGDDRAALDRYAEVTGYVADAGVLDFYRLRWALDDISIYVGELRSPHVANADVEASWESLEGWLRAVASGSASVA